MCLLENGDEVIGLEPMYLTYEATLRVGGADLVRVPQPASSGFRPDPALIEAAVTERTRAIVITSPNNPTGVTLTEAELERIAELAIANDLWVISDEVYSDIVFEGTHTSIASLPGMAERTVTVSSLSKSHAMTGWRVGWAVGPAELIRHIGELQINVNYGLPGFVQAAALTALTEHRNAYQQMKDTYRRRRDLCAEHLGQASGLSVLVPEAGMYLMADVSHLSKTSTQFTRELFDSTGVSVLDAGAFGASCEGWVRISFTLSDDDLAEACGRIVEFCGRA
jgi:aspartate/methionine/tyrosine aminotransferase